MYSPEAAELYKLNLYSGPSAKFKSHVDTPRSTSHFGSLVVCLPLQFRGGALQVRHQGKAVTFDWSTAINGSDGETPCICWAAFYSDCEHEIFEVTEGYRLTLTYILYSTRGNGQLRGHYPWLDPTSLPLYKIIHDLVRDEDWEKGGLIGYNCSHVYPHTNKTKLNFLAPDNLKGADMLLHPEYDHDDEGDTLPIVGLSLRQQTWDRCENYVEEVWDTWAGRNKADGKERWWLAYGEENSEADSEEEKGRYVNFLNVHWLNDWGHHEPNVTQITYGNEAHQFVAYSCVTMIVEIPPSNKQEVEEAGAD